MSFKNKLLLSSRVNKQILVASTDFLSISLAVLLACLASNIVTQELTLNEILRLLWIPLFTVFIFYLFGIYRSVLRYIDFAVIYLLCKAIMTAFILNLVIRLIYINFLHNFFNDSFQGMISGLGWVVGFLTSIILVVGSRIYANFLLSNKKSEKRVVIYGAGSAGIQLAEALKVSEEMQPIAFIDSNFSLHDTYLGGIKILNPKNLEKLIYKGKVDEVLIAMPSASKSVLRDLLNQIESYSVKVRILPGLAELAQGKVLVSELKEVQISDLLGRYEVEPNQDLINKNIKGKVVCITGAGGSIGSEITRQVCVNEPKSIIILDSNEYSLYSLKTEIESLIPNRIDVHSILANVSNQARMIEIFKTFKVNTIYHTAAYKHVPLVEENICEGVSNNVFGTYSCVNAAIESKVDTFVLISTDKAVRPTNIMGATKRFSEMILQSYSEEKKFNNTRMTMVRFGNVLGSSGSAIPLFQQQIKDGGPVTVTDPEVIRYFMSIPEAAELVIQAGAMGEGGDVFVLDMGEPVKIIDLAKRLINLSGLELKDGANPEGDIEIIFTGLRPGEKLYEELLIGDNVKITEHKQILRAEEQSLSRNELENYLNLLQEAIQKDDVVTLKGTLEEAVRGFVPEKSLVDSVYLKRQANLES
ncbi:MAG: polysaccharide biosynthesis protein [Candidatus Marinimicrobia bacterium]|nr:polysaccharide biosynthesis protein [Candidatus Neomarinimicrobiota bacterium]|tara:strand:+ start:53 stop:1984 length:1932 start_codon:yes stop_codon:yes gene_type:complete